jgi:hypothetical protein
MSEPLKELCDLLRENNMRFVFWVCPNGNHRGVTWEHGNEGSVATCDVCGKKSKTGAHTSSHALTTKEKL